MFDYDKTLRVLEDFKHLSSKKQKKVMKSLFYDDTFIEWLFQPKQVPNLKDTVSAMYAQFTKPIVMEAMVEAIKEEGYREFTRSHATFLFSVANIAIQGNNEMLEEISRQKKDDEISGKEARRLSDKIEESNEIINSLLKVAKKIIKRDAAELARESHLPKYICMTALHSIPEPKYIDKYKIGFYLNNLFNSIYSEVEENGEFETNVRWKVFFKEIFGKDNVVEAATFVLLEGVHRIDKYINSKDVKVCWDSLTTFALRELNDAPQQLRQQMIELYIKRIDKMFANKSFDLRVDLTDISDRAFPNLVETIEKYTDKITSILNKGLDRDDD
jgi:hypothetical protein